MKVAAGQFAVTSDSEKNVQLCVNFMEQAQAAQVDLLVLPEALLARDDNDPDLSVKSAQPLDGAFVSALCQAPLAGEPWQQDDDVSYDSCAHNGRARRKYADRPARGGDRCGLSKDPSL